MSITRVGTPQGGSAVDAGDVTLTFDVAPQENDVVYVFGGPALISAAAIVTAGYTQVYTISANKGQKGFRKVMGATPDTAVVCEGGTDARDAVTYVAIVLRGVDTTTPEDATPTVVSSGGVSANPNPPSITTVTDGAWVLAVGALLGNDASPGVISGYGNDKFANAADTFPATVALATREIASAGPENPGAWSTFGPGAQWSAASVAVRPAAVSGLYRMAHLSGLGTGGRRILDPLQ